MVMEAVLRAACGRVTWMWTTGAAWFPGRCESVGNGRHGSSSGVVATLRQFQRPVMRRAVDDESLRAGQPGHAPRSWWGGAQRKKIQQRMRGGNATRCQSRPSTSALDLLEAGAQCRSHSQQQSTDQGKKAAHPKRPVLHPAMQFNPVEESRQ